jgi:RNA polymerase sigma-70 factor, ECF subfamily
VSSNESFMYLRNRNKSRSREISVEELKNNETDESYGVFQYNDHHSRPDNIILENEQRSMLDNAINELPEEYRVVFQLRDIEGLSNNEVADILGLTIPAVKSRILRSRNQLRKKLINYFPEYQS